MIFMQMKGSIKLEKFRLSAIRKVDDNQTRVHSLWFAVENTTLLTKT